LVEIKAEIDGDPAAQDAPLIGAKLSYRSLMRLDRAGRTRKKHKM